jgi:XTP/dITP diphosphohydrolase
MKNRFYISNLYHFAAAPVLRQLPGYWCNMRASNPMRETQLVLASSNTGKLRELQALLTPLNLVVRSQQDFNVPTIAETGLTFIENAILKARNAAKHTGLPAIADDSGLEVDTLNGAPGIYSARYAGPRATDQENTQKLLRELTNVEQQRRTARFQCIVVYMRHPSDPTPLVCQGTWEGLIVDHPRGDNGFGYDPVFYVAAYGCTAAELDADTKNRASHRGQALAQLVKRLS